MMANYEQWYFDEYNDRSLKIQHISESYSFIIFCCDAVLESVILVFFFSYKKTIVLFSFAMPYIFSSAATL